MDGGSEVFEDHGQRRDPGGAAQHRPTQEFTAQDHRRVRRTRKDRPNGHRCRFLGDGRQLLGRPGQHPEQVVEPGGHREVHVGLAVKYAGGVDENEALHIVRKTGGHHQRQRASHGVPDEVVGSLQSLPGEGVNELGVAFGGVKLVGVGRSAETGQVEGHDAVVGGERGQHRVPIAHTALTQAVDEDHRRGLRIARLHHEDLAAEDWRGHHLRAVSRQAANGLVVDPARCRGRRADNGHGGLGWRGRAAAGAREHDTGQPKTRGHAKSHGPGSTTRAQPEARTRSGSTRCWSSSHPRSRPRSQGR